MLFGISLLGISLFGMFIVARCNGYSTLEFIIPTASVAVVISVLITLSFYGHS